MNGGFRFAISAEQCTSLDFASDQLETFTLHVGLTTGNL